MNPGGPPVTFGEWVKIRRRKLDLTQSELADRAGCSVFALRKIESAERRPSKQLANLLAKALEISQEELPKFLKVARGEMNLSRLGSVDTDSHSFSAPTTLTSKTVSPLPVFAGQFIGREQELSALSRLLVDPQCRLLTLVGPGGIGKTRLAVMAASLNQQVFADGLCFISLAALHSASYIVPAIADALGISFHGHNEPLAQLIFHLRGKEVLLVLDNAEHLLNDVSLYSDLLEGAPTIKLLVTSRERLNLQQEWVFEIQGLPAPSPSHAVNPQEYSSVMLFIQAARRSYAAFEPQPADLVEIAKICRMLDGMPLGIELAATWINVLPCAEITIEMAQSLDILATNLKNVPERQRSLRAAFDYSWHLISEEERKVLARLSVFRGGFERQQAEQIVGTTLSILQALVTKSLVRRKSSGRFELHEVIRQYAYAQFEIDPEMDRVLDAHTAIYLRFLADRRADLKGPAQFRVLQELRSEMNNLRGAWDRAVDRKAFDQLGGCIRSLGWFCDISGYLGDGIDMLEKLVAGLRAETADDDFQRLIGISFGQMGLITFRQGHFEQALTYLDQSLQILRPFNEPDFLTDPVIIKGVIHHLNGDFDLSKTLILEGLDWARRVGDRWWEGYAIFNLGYIESLMGNYDAGYEQMLQGLAIWRELNDASTIALGLNHICPTALRLNKIEEAQVWLEESVELCSKVGDRWGLGTAYRNLGLTFLIKGETDEALHYLIKSLDLFTGFTTGWDLIRSNIFIGEVYRVKKEYAQARQIFQDAVRQALNYQSNVLALDATASLALVNLVDGHPNVAFEMAQLVLSESRTTHFVRERAEKILYEARNRLDIEEIEKATERLERLSLVSVFTDPSMM